MVEQGSAVAGRRLPPPGTRPVLTNFYPLYGGANDQVDPVTPVRRAFFQPIIPRYRLSTSETRDEGLGPEFVYAPVRSYPDRRPPGTGSGASGPRQSPGLSPGVNPALAEDSSRAHNRRGGQTPATLSALYRLDQLPPLPRDPGLGRRVNIYA
ncbi:MAG: hypothetical protein ACLFP6_01745 [Spirochaetaceae bacterium]